MNLTAIKARLKTDKTVIKKVAGALSLAEVKNKKITVSPTCFVVPLTNSGQPRKDTTGPFEQRVKVKFAVVIAIKSLSSASGDGADELLQTTINKVRELLFGWKIDNTPELDYKSNALGNSGLVTLSDYTVWWQEEFTTSYFQLSKK